MTYKVNRNPIGCEKVLCEESGSHLLLSPVIKLGLHHARNKQRKKERKKEKKYYSD